MEVQLSFAQKIRKKALKLVKIAQFHFFLRNWRLFLKIRGKKVPPLTFSTKILEISSKMKGICRFYKRKGLQNCFISAQHSLSTRPHFCFLTQLNLKTKPKRLENFTKKQQLQFSPRYRDRKKT